MSDHKTGEVRTLRDKILKCITDAPGMVVYRDAIMETTGFDEDQVTGVMGRFKASDNPIAPDVEVVVPGRAWRYVPGAAVRRAVRAVAKPIKSDGDRDRSMPLTESIRRYFYKNPGRVVYLAELCEMMSDTDEPMDERRVQVGVNNARSNNREFKECLSSVLPSRAWIYTPPPDPSTTSKTPRTGPTTSLAVEPSSTTTVEARPTIVISTDGASPRAPQGNDQSLLIFEDLGTMDDGTRLVRDEDRQLYRLIKM